VLVQASGLALLAAFSPTALLVMAVYLGSAHPRRTAICYLIGAVAVSAVVAIAALLILHAGGLAKPSEREPRFGLRLAIGLVALVVGIIVGRRKPKQADPEAKRVSVIDRLVASPAPGTAFIAGLVIFGPSITFIAAVQVIATAKAGVVLVAVALIIVVLINVMFVWLPLILYLVAPETTACHLGAFNAWLRLHGHVLLTAVLIAVGVILIINGAAGLAS
jgi:hypothetical protein